MYYSLVLKRLGGSKSLDDCTNKVYFIFFKKNSNGSLRRSIKQFNVVWLLGVHASATNIANDCNSGCHNSCHSSNNSSDNSNECVERLCSHFFLLDLQ